MARKGRTSKAVLNQRMDYIQMKLQENGSVNIVKLRGDLARKFEIAPQTADNLIEKILISSLEKDKPDVCLVDGNIELRPVAAGIGAKWKNTRVGERLESPKLMASKYLLAQKVVEMLVDEEIHSVFLSSGTTCYAVADEILRRKQEVPVGIIYSISLLVFDCFREHDPKEIKLVLLSGRFDRNTGTLVDDHNQNMKGVRFTAIVASFTALCKGELYASESWEATHMQKLIQKGSSCEMVIIPMTWDKICSGASHSAYLIEGGLPSKHKQTEKCTRYIIVTNPSQDEKDRDSEQKAILDYWQEHCGEVAYTST